MPQLVSARHHTLLCCVSEMPAVLALRRTTLQTNMADAAAAKAEGWSVTDKYKALHATHSELMRNIGHTNPVSKRQSDIPAEHLHLLHICYFPVFLGSRCDLPIRLERFAYQGVLQAFGKPKELSFTLTSSGSGSTTTQPRFLTNKSPHETSFSLECANLQDTIHTCDI